MRNKTIMLLAVAVCWRGTNVGAQEIFSRRQPPPFVSQAPVRVDSPWRYLAAAPAVADDVRRAPAPTLSYDQAELLRQQEYERLLASWNAYRAELVRYQARYAPSYANVGVERPTYPAYPTPGNAAYAPPLREGAYGYDRPPCGRPAAGQVPADVAPSLRPSYPAGNPTRYGAPLTPVTNIDAYRQAIRYPTQSAALASAWD